MLDVSLGSGTINCAIEASKWRRYWVWVVAAGSIATRKAAQAQDRSHFGVPSGFDRFCPGSRRQVLEYSHMPAPCLLALNKIASNLDRAINGSCPSSRSGPGQMRTVKDRKSKRLNTSH